MLTVLMLVFAACVYAQDLAPEDAGDIPGVYDFYVFNRFWMPEACFRSTDTGCTSLNASSWAVSNLASHGIWPEYNVGWPQYCYQDNTTYWNKVSTLSSSFLAANEHVWAKIAPLYNTGLGQHEWEKHGTCATADLVPAAAQGSQAVEAIQQRYFNNMAELFNNFPTPSVLPDAAASGQPLTPAQIQATCGGPNYCLLGCNFDSKGKAFLNMVTICLAKDSDGNPTTQIECVEDTITSDYDNSCITDGATAIYVMAWK